MLGFNDTPKDPVDRQFIVPALQELLHKIHPLSLGNVHRTHRQIEVLARMLLKKHYGEGDGINAMVTRLTTSYYSHHHMISRHEAFEILGKDHVGFADGDLAHALDDLLRRYEDDFGMRKPFIMAAFMGNDSEKDARFIGGCVESGAWGYLFETKTRFRQFAAPPQGISVQVAAGAPIPLIPGFPRRFEWQTLSRGWVHNKAPQGITV